MAKFWSAEVWNQRGEAFIEWLKANGAEFKPLTNPWELVRFKFHGNFHVLHRNAKGRVTMDDEVHRIITSFDGAAWVEVTRLEKKTPKTFHVPSQQIMLSNSDSPSFTTINLRKKGQGMHSLFLSATTIPHGGFANSICSCTEPPWEDCIHTAEDDHASIALLRSFQ